MTPRHPRTPRGVRAALAGVAYALGELLREIGDSVADGRSRRPVGTRGSTGWDRVPDAFVRQGPPQEWLDHVAAGQPEWFGSPAAGPPEAAVADPAAGATSSSEPPNAADVAAGGVRPAQPRTRADSAERRPPERASLAPPREAGPARLIRTPRAPEDSTGHSRIAAADPQPTAAARADLIRPAATRPAPGTRRARLRRADRTPRSAGGGEAAGIAAEPPPPLRPSERTSRTSRVRRDPAPPLHQPAPPSTEEWPTAAPPWDTEGWPPAPRSAPTVRSDSAPRPGSIPRSGADPRARVAATGSRPSPYPTRSPWPDLDLDPETEPSDWDRWSPAPGDPAAGPDRGTVPHLWALLTEQRSDLTITAQRRR